MPEIGRSNYTENMDHYRETCLVEIAPSEVWQKMLKSSEKNDKEDSAYSASGVLISQEHGYVVTHGSILLTYFAKNKELLKKLVNVGHVPSSALQKLKALITLESLKKKSLSVRRDDNFQSIFNATSANNNDSNSQQHIGKIELVWKADNFAKAVDVFLPSTDQWSFFENPEQGSNANDVDPDLVAHLLPYFVLIKLDNWSNNSKVKSHICEGDYAIGDTVHIVGTPFGSMSPVVFMNSVSQGIVCNMAGKHQELIVTDARCIPGSEGGPLYYGAIHESRSLMGIIASALCWKSNEWIGLSLVCNISEVLQSLSKVLQLPELHSSVEYIIQKSGSKTSSTLTPSGIPVVLVTVGSTWGSGIIIDQEAGIVLTCGHVLKNARHRVKVRVDLPTMKWYVGKVIHATSLNHPFDIGVIKLKDYKPRSCWKNRITVAEDIAQGDPCYVVGHAMFGQELSLPPSITQGVISKIVTEENVPVMIQSTCTVNAGASGGPLVSRDGTIIGIITCNARDTGSGAAFPHINLSVPMITIWPLLEKYLDHSDPSVLDSLQLDNAKISNLWAMRESKRNLEELRSKL